LRFLEVDPLIRAWSRERRLPLYTQHQDSEVRTFLLVGPSGKKAQIWIEVIGGIAVHAWDYKKRRWMSQATEESLSNKLDEALACAQSWIA